MIGPTLPPHLRRDKPEQEGRAENNDSSADEDSYGPALPPALAARRAQPAPAPRSAPEPTVDDESSDDEIGPRPPAPSTSRQATDDGIREFLEREQRRKELAEVRKSVYH
jgi:hypothetical protein